MSLYLEKGVSGTAWFDDLVVTEVVPDLMWTELLTPGYRGLLIPGDHESVALTAHVVMDPAQLAAHSVTVTVVDSSGEVIDSQTSAAAEEVDYSCPASTLPISAVTVGIELVETANDTAVVSDQWEVTKLDSVPASYVDRHGRFIRDGVFPLGFYTNTINDASLASLADPVQHVLGLRATDYRSSGPRSCQRHQRHLFVHGLLLRVDLALQARRDRHCRG